MAKTFKVDRNILLTLIEKLMTYDIQSKTTLLCGCLEILSLKKDITVDYLLLFLPFGFLSIWVCFQGPGKIDINVILKKIFIIPK